jgi:hypothetical protein
VPLQSKFNYEVAKKVAYSPSRSFGSLRGRFVRQSRDHVAVVLAWAAYRLELGDHDNVNQIAALFCPGEPQPLRAAAHVFAVAEIPPPSASRGRHIRVHVHPLWGNATGSKPSIRRCLRSASGIDRATSGELHSNTRALHPCSRRERFGGRGGVDCVRQGKGGLEGDPGRQGPV